MVLSLVPHAAATSDRLHCWVGIADVDAAPALAWRLNGAAVAPEAKRPLTPVLAGPLAARARTTAFTGSFELRDLQPDTSYTVEVSAGSEHIARRIATLPARVPVEPAGRLNVLLLSCFHRLEDKTGVAGAVLSRLGVTPHLTLFAGDQVYLDLPTLADFEDDRAWLADKFQRDYLDNWFGDRRPGRDPQAIPPGYPQVLSLAPAAFMPDDHEYWNNYPFWTTPAQNSWTAAGRCRWKEAAEATYCAFQQTGAVPFGTAQTIDVEPLSILMLDTRSQRSQTSLARDRDLLGKPGQDALRDWVTRLVDRARDPQPWFGMLVTGQSFFRPAAGIVQGAVADYEFPNYEADYRFMVEQVQRVTQAGLPLILATGDVHWGRVLEAIDPAVPGAPVFEVISSPTSLVSTIGVDQVNEVWGAIKGLFGTTDPWPRHSDPGAPPERFGGARQYFTHVRPRASGGPATMRGNQAFMLRFVRAGGGLDVEVACYPLSGRPAFDAADRWSTELRLRPPRGA